jgi:DinB superfamily
MSGERISSTELIGQVHEARARAAALVQGLTPEQLSQRTNPSSWSISECLAHLNLTAATVQPKVGVVIERGKKEKITGQGLFSPGPLGWLLIWIAEPPPKFRMRAPKGIVPKVTDGDPAEVVAEFMKVQDEWERLIGDGEGLDQKRLKVSSLFPGMPALRLAAPIPWMMAHQRRHLLQAEKVKQQIVPGATSVQRAMP